jgi:hypothetical protein
MQVNRPIADMTVRSGDKLAFTIPSDSFVSNGSGAKVTLQATQTNGQALPLWLKFDPETGKLTGTPPPGVSSNIAVRIQARDSEGRQATQTFRIQVGGQAAR